MSVVEKIKAAVASMSEAQKDALRKALDGTPEPIAVIGIGCRMPGGIETADGLWAALCAGVDGVREIPPDRWDADAWYDPDPRTPGKMVTKWAACLDDVRGFDHRVFGISPREARWMDPQQRLFLEVAHETFDHAGWGGRIGGTRTGVFAGVCTFDYALLRHRTQQIDAYTASGLCSSIIPNRVSYKFDLLGPSLAVDTACSSSLLAVHLAVRSLRCGESDMALAGGVNLLLSPANFISYSKWGMMARDGRCKTFDARADGFVRGEGCGAVLLKRLSDAQRDGDRVYAVVRGSATNQDGLSAGLTAPTPASQVDVIRRALADAGMNGDEIGYVEAHGTGTSLGDPIEVESLYEALGARAGRVIGSIKSNFGHLEGAAGIAGFIKLVLTLHHGSIPASLHFERPNPNIDFSATGFTVPTEVTPWDGPRAGGVSSFGFGGANVHAVLAQAPEPPVVEPEQSRPRALVMSGHDERAVHEMAAGYARLLANGARFDELCAAAMTRASGPHRAAVVASNRDDAQDKLQKIEVHPARARPRVGFVFGGQGSVWSGMGATQHRVFREAFEACAAAVGRAGGAPIVLDDAERLSTTEVAQAATFCHQIALARTLIAYGVEPGFVIGHSLGEITAAHIAGALTLDQAARVVVVRAKHMQLAHGAGRMFETDAREPAFAGLDVAAMNAPGATVLSGPVEVAEAAFTQLEAQGARCTWLDVEYAFHSEQMAEAASAVAIELRDLAPASPSITVYSTVDDGRPSFDADYWARNVRQTVRFASAVEAAVDSRADAFIEIGPRPVLLRSLEAITNTAGSDCKIIASSRRNRDEATTALRAVAQVFCLGGELQTPPDEAASCRLPLPPYPWQRTEHWTEGPEYGVDVPASGIRRIESPAVDGAVFALSVSADSPPFMRDHMLGGMMLFPAAGWPEYFNAAARQLEPGSYAVEELQLLSPLAVALDDRKEVQILLRDGQAEVVSRDATGWVTHVRGRVVPQVGAPPALDISQTLARLSETNDGASFYEDLVSRGAELGPRFQGIQKVHRVDGEALAEVFVPNMIEPASAIDPAVIDCALQTFLAAIPDELRQQGSGFLPFRIERISVYSNPPGKLWAHAKLIEVSSQSVLLDVGLADESGEWAAVAAGVRFVRHETAHEDVQLRQLLRRDVYRLEWKNTSAGARDEGVVWRAEGEDFVEISLDFLEAVRAHEGEAGPFYAVTRGAYDENPNPVQAAVVGLARVAALEMPKLDLRIVDVSGDGQDHPITSCSAPLMRIDGDQLLVPRVVRSPVRAQPLTVRSDRTYVVTGGGGGLGRVLVRQLLDAGAGQVVVLQRSPAPEELQDRLRVVRGDVSVREDVERLFDGCGELGAVLHAAGVVEDALIRDLDRTRLKRGIAAKVAGTDHILEWTAGRDLDAIILFSSAAALLAAPGQGAYVAANAYMDAAALRARGEGRPVVSVGWGAIEGDGMAARTGDTGRRRAEAMGVLPIAADLAMRTWAFLSTGKHGHVGVLRMDWEKFASRRKDAELFEALVGEASPRKAAVDTEFRGRLAAAPAVGKRTLLQERIRSDLAEALELDGASQVDVDAGLFDLGVDSMIAVEVSERLETALGVPLPPTLVFDNPTVRSIADSVLTELQEPAAEEDDQLDGATDEELLAMLEQEIE